jgi:UDP-3-O-[3-hydroxymyristoyl] N-acetylglucosamine deacetylase
MQHTLAAPVTVSGIGVHSGAPANLVLRPAPAGAGIVFVRSDLSGDNVIPALWDKVVDTRLCTIIANASGAKVSTVEHVLSALAAAGVDNAVIDIDGPEVPIMDGSAIRFLNAIEAVGLMPQEGPRRVLAIRREVVVEDGDKRVTFSPADASVFAMDIIYDNPLIGHQALTHVLTSGAYRADIARSRSFGFLHEWEALRKMGLARASSLENAVAIDGDRVLNPEGMHWPDEPVRHKILDAIGDMYLAGLPLLGRYHGIKAGHTMNNTALRALMAQADAWEIVEIDAPAAFAPMMAQDVPYAAACA